MLEGININLRAMEKADIPFYHEWATKPTAFGEYSPVLEYSKDELEKRFNQFSNEVK